MAQQALLLIDAQVNMFASEDPVFDAPRILRNLKDLLHLAREEKMQVIFIQHNGGAGEPDQPNTAGWQIHPQLKRDPKDIVIQKNEMDAFAKTDLEDQLRKLQINDLIIAGLQTDFCIQTNVLKARKLGFQVQLITDAHSTRDSKTETADQIIRRINDELETPLQTVG